MKSEPNFRAGVLAGLQMCVAFGVIASADPAVARGKKAHAIQSASGWQIAIGAAGGIDDFDHRFWDHGVADAVGVSLEVAKRINRHVALDLRAHYFVDQFRHSPTLCEDGEESRLGAATAGVKLFPWQGPIEPYVSAGAGGVYRRFVEFGCEDGKEVAGTGVVPGVRFGGGIDVRLHERWSLGIETHHVIPIESEVKPKFRYTTVGAAIRFRF